MPTTGLHRLTNEQSLVEFLCRVHPADSGAVARTMEKRHAWPAARGERAALQGVRMLLLRKNPRPGLDGQTRPFSGAAQIGLFSSRETTLGAGEIAAKWGAFQFSRLLQD